MSKNHNIELGKILDSSKFTIAVAESLTGGSLGSSFVSIPGSSHYFHGGVIAYDNLVKINLLQVSEKTIQDLGAVSEACAAEMALGVKKLFNTDIALSVTGIAGPGGATSIKPVGLVYAGFIVKDKSWVKKFNFSGDRSSIINQTVEDTLAELIKELKN